MALRQREAAESEGALAAAHAAQEEADARAAAQKAAAEAAAADAAARAEEAAAAAVAAAAAAAARLVATDEARRRLDDELQARLSTKLQPSASKLRPYAFTLRATLRAQEARGAVRVYCRLRPLRSTETGPAAGVGEYDAHSLPSKVLLRCPLAGGGSDGERCFEFDRVFGSEASTEQVFDDRMQARAGCTSTSIATATTSTHHHHRRPGAYRPWRPRCRTAAARR